MNRGGSLGFLAAKSNMVELFLTRIQKRFTNPVPLESKSGTFQPDA